MKFGQRATSELLTPLRPDAMEEDMEKCCVLLEEEIIRSGERARDLARRESEFLRNQMKNGANDIFRLPHDKNLHRNIDFHNKWEADHMSSVRRKYNHMLDPVTKLCYFHTTAKNVEATQEVMFDKSLVRDDRLKYLAYLLKKAQQQQNDSKVWSGKLANDSRLCALTGKSAKVAAPPEPEGNLAGSSSHNKGSEKDPKKDKQPHNDGAQSRTGSSLHREAGKDHDQHRSRERKEDPRKEKEVPPRQDRQWEKEDPPRREGSMVNLPPPPLARRDKIPPNIYVTSQDFQIFENSKKIKNFLKIIFILF